MGYVCLLGDESCTVTMLQTSLKNGATVGLCDEHEPMAYIGALAASLGVEPDRLYESIQRFVDREAKKAQAELDAAQKAENAPPAECAECGSLVPDVHRTDCSKYVPDPRIGDGNADPA